MFVEDIIKTLQASVAPCLLISGFGFLLLTMTNRLGRASDRIRQLLKSLEQDSGPHRHILTREIKIIFNRCRYLRSAIFSLILSIATVAVNVLLLFLSIVFGLNLAMLIQFLFATSLICLILSLFMFMLDISLTLKTLQIEIEHKL